MKEFRDFVADGYIYICRRNDDDYVLARNADGTDSYDLPRNYDLSPYSFEWAQAYYDDNPDKRFEEKPFEPTPQEILEAELETLLSWFDWYDQQCMQYQRSQRMGVSWEGDIDSLDALAVIKARRINEIRNQLDID